MLTDEHQGQDARATSRPLAQPGRARPAGHRDQPGAPEVRAALARHAQARARRSRDAAAVAGQRGPRMTARAVQVSSAGLPGWHLTRPAPHRHAGPVRPTTGASPDDARPIRDLLREARAAVREVSPAEAELAARARRAASSTSARPASGSRATSPAPRHVSKSYIEQEIEAAAPDHDAAGRPLLRRRHPLAVRGPDARRTWATRTSPR